MGGRRGGRRAAACLAVLLAAAGCGGTGGTGDDVLGEVIIVLPDPGRDPGPAPDEGDRDLAGDPDAPRDEAPGDAADAGDPGPGDLPPPPRDAGDEAPDGDTPPGDPGADPAPGDALPDAAPDGGPGDPGGDAPDAPDAGNPLCAPGSSTCRCDADEDCDPLYGSPCKPNRCDVPNRRCMLDSAIRNGLECQDGDFCTTGETCRWGACSGGVETCECRADDDCADDGNPCTAKACDLGTCAHPPAEGPCPDDGNPCTFDLCAEGACTHPPAEGPCADDGNPCTFDLCAEGACTHPPAEGPCADDGNPCTDDFCGGGACTHPFNAAPCDDDDACTTGDACALGACVPGARVCECDRDARCDDGVPCTADTCVEGACRHDLDAGWCRIADACVGAGTPEPANRCRACDPAADPLAWTPVADGAPCDDGVPCTDDACLAGACAPVLSPAWCRIADACVAAGTPEPANPCRACDPAAPLDWTAVADGAPCDDDDACTEPDACLAGACLPGSRVCECDRDARCDDGNPCTDDACVDRACSRTPNALPCEDGDPATLGDRCAAGLCVPGIPCGDGTCARASGETCATCLADCLGPCPATEIRCSDGWDDDLDGRTDCGDADDCRFDGACLPPDACAQVDDDVSCGFDLSYQWSLTNDLKGTACGLSLGGDDTIWRFRSATTRTVTFRVEDPSSSDTMSAIVLAGACNGLACLKAATGDPAVVTFTAEAGRTYYLVYDEIVYMAGVRARVTCN